MLNTPHPTVSGEAPPPRPPETRHMNTRLNWRRTLKSAKLSLLVPVLLGGGAVAQTISRVSLDSVGSEGDAGSEFPAISADGRWVAFQSYAGNLVANDNNSNLDVFIKDR